MNTLKTFLSTTTGRVLVITATAVLIETAAEKLLDRKTVA